MARGSSSLGRGTPGTGRGARTDETLSPTGSEGSKTSLGGPPNADAWRSSSNTNDVNADNADPGGGPAAASEPFAPRQLWRLDQALASADRETGLTFSIFVGELEVPTSGAAKQFHGQLGAQAPEAVLIAVSPNQRVLEIVTGPAARRVVPDRVCALAVLSMTAAFEGGDLAGGLITGLRMLADQARR